MNVSSFALRSYILSLVYLFPLAVTQVHAADLDGSADYPNMSRIKDSTILGYDLRDYDFGEFIVGFREAERELDYLTVEGERGRWIYLVPAGRAGLGVLRNYQSILKGMGEVSEVYECALATCPANLGGVIFNRNKSFTTTLGSDSQWLYHQPYYYSDQLYLYATVAGADTDFHISIYVATQTDRSHSANKELRGRTLVHLEIVTPEEFEADLEQVTAVEMNTSDRQGRIHRALRYLLRYGQGGSQIRICPYNHRDRNTLTVGSDPLRLCGRAHRQCG